MSVEVDADAIVGEDLVASLKVELLISGEYLRYRFAIFGVTPSMASEVPASATAE